MYYKQYGDTQMKVSAIGFGCMRYPDEDVAAGNFEKCAQLPLYAYEKGINYFDTAPYYCNDKSEMITGMAISQMPREKIFVSSKTNFGTIGNVITEAAFMKRLEQSLERLKTDYLDFYHLWCLLSIESYEEQSDALYGFFEKAKAQGLIRNIVFSSHMQGNDIEQVVNSGKFKGMLIGYNALNYRFRQSGIEAAYKNGMGVVVMNPLGGGLIPAAADKFDYLKQGSDLSVPQAALRFVASHKEITIALNGFSQISHIDDAVKAVENLQERPAAEIVKEFEEMGVGANDLCTGCGYCKGCPKDIPIPKFMDAYNQMILSGESDSIMDRINNHWNIDPGLAAECIACKKCEKQCTQHLPIIDRLAQISSLRA